MFNENLSETEKNQVLQIKKILMALMTLFLVVLVLFFAVKSINEIQKGKYIGQGIAPTNTISVFGKGEVFVKPDIAKISISVEKEAYSVSDAQNQATEAINKITAFLKESAIEEKDIKTTNYNIYPRYDYIEKVGRVFRGYVVSQSLEVKIRKIDKVGEILSGVTKAGANQIGGVVFTIDDEEVPKREARQKAISDAKAKAEQLAKDLGVSLVRLVNFSESGGEIPIYRSFKAEALELGGGEPIPDVPSGENQVVINVLLTYEVK